MTENNKLQKSNTLNNIAKTNIKIKLGMRAGEFITDLSNISTCEVPSLDLSCAKDSFYIGII